MDCSPLLSRPVRSEMEVARELTERYLTALKNLQRGVAPGSDEYVAFGDAIEGVQDYAMDTFVARIKEYAREEAEAREENLPRVKDAAWL